MKSLTIDQAIKEGYKYCGIVRQEILDHIDGDYEYVKSKLKDNEIFLAEKKAETLNIPSAGEIMEGIVESNYDILAEDRDVDVREYLKAYEKDFQNILDIIETNAYLDDASGTYFLTDIRLTN